MKKNILALLFLFSSVLQLVANSVNQYQAPKILDSQQGLSSTKVNSIVQDDKSFVWIATEDGLNKFDGYHFTVYKRIEGDSTSLLSNNISTLCYDSRKRLWVGSMSGLQYYDERKNRFVEAFLGQPEDIMLRNAYNWIMEDSQGYIWFSVHDLGVFKYSPETEQSVLYKPLAKGGQLCSMSMRHIAEDGDGNIWFSSLDQGISVYNPKDDSFRQYNAANSKLPTNSVLRMCLMKNGNMLVTTIGDGVWIFDKNAEEFHRTNARATAFSVTTLSDGTVLIGTEGEGLLYASSPFDMIHSYPAIPKHYNEVISSKIHYLMEDNNGDLWIGMYNNGVCYIRKEPEGFTSYQKKYDDPNSLSYGQVAGITTDKNGNIWFATDGGGLNMYDRKTEKYTHYRHKAGDFASLPDDAVVAVINDSRDNIWVGMYTGGLSRLDRTTGKFTTYQYANEKNFIPDNFVKSIVEDKDGNFWLGTDGGGLSYFDTSTETFTNYSASEYDGFISNNIISLYLQNDNILWIGGYTGIFKFDIANKKFISYENEVSVSNLTINSITEDNAKNLWIGTSSGLYKYDSQNDSFLIDSLSGNYQSMVINAVVPFRHYLWISTNNGMLCYEPYRKQIVALVNNNDLGGINFIRSSYYISPDDEISFGGGNGCYSFYPDRMPLGDYSPKVYITNLEIFNQPIQVGKKYKGRVILDESLDYTDHITLKHSENTFTFHFSSPTTLFPASISYLCYLDGVDKQWLSFPPTQQSVTYANLPPGVYTFQVYASNVPNSYAKNITTLTIEILPPLWLTWWAKTGYVIAVILLLALIFWVAYNRMKDKHELNIERLKAKKQEELNENKMQFFTNISHEFRTPLTLIISPLEEMEKTETSNERRQLIQVMLRNADRLLRLINQILDLRKAENNKITVKAKPVDLVLFARDFIGLFTDVTRKRKIDLTVNSNAEETIVWYDPDLLEKGLYNLVSNALKYTPDDGEINITIDQQPDGDVILAVTDTGCGIAEDEQPYLFDRFYQGEYSRTSGSGIGLHLVKTIVDLHNGNISVDSSPGVGSCFSIFILGGKEHLDANSYTDEPWLPVGVESVSSAAEEDEDDEVFDDEKDEKQVGTEQPLILLVEDEDDMRSYIHSRLSDSYRVVEAVDGKEALRKLKTIHPDLIITDVMMPEMDGIEFTRIVKENIDTCHIPVILLTANGETEQKLKGLETGADSYIVKPFNSEYLHIRIRKLLEIRKKMQEKFSKLLNLEAQEVEITNPDEQLLQNCIGFIRDNINEPDLSVEEMAKKMNISRTNLHRKIKTLTGTSPVELIKTIRMKQAAYLLDKGVLTISEVAYEVGYNSLSYFSSSFSAYWGVSPSEYVKSDK
ncbi:MAG: response regulator [Prevotella sp.]|jgi:signal transduction histidine kinase/ligand-binding sensor domain-containing protein/AraC-like DNA-binding protein|nr:response regulator [Prevotella sp.]